MAHKKVKLLPVEGTVVTVEKKHGKTTCFDESGIDYSSVIFYATKQNALKKDGKLTFTGGHWSTGAKAPKGSGKSTAWKKKPQQTATETNVDIESINEDELNIIQQIHDAIALQPRNLKMSELNWRHLIRTIFRAQNLLITGPSRTGKTKAVKLACKALGRELFKFNMGATQEARTFLLGNTQFKADEGTFFNESLFIRAVQTPNAVILLDELTRAHPDAWNILMEPTDTDFEERKVLLDEKVGSPVIKVHPTVTFIATANIGSRYTATRVLDGALMERFGILEMEILNKKDESDLLRLEIPTLSDEAIDKITSITETTRKEVESLDPKIQNAISTGLAIKLGGMLADGFTLAEASLVGILPYYSAEGGSDSERTFVKSIIQRYCDDGTSNVLF